MWILFFIHKHLFMWRYITLFFWSIYSYCFYAVVDYENDDDDAIYWEAPQTTDTQNEPKQDDNDRDNRRGGDKKRFRDESEDTGV
jgi:hypothetical protein